MDALGIANAALQNIGQAKIAGFGDDSARSRACLTYFVAVVDEVTTRRKWTFATKRAALSRDDVSDNLTSYGYIFDLPADCLRLFEIVPAAENIVEGGKLYCNESSLTGVYVHTILDEDDDDYPIIADGENPSELFCLACAARLSYFLVQPLTGRPELLNIIASQYAMALQEAEAEDARKAAIGDQPVDKWEDVS